MNTCGKKIFYLPNKIHLYFVILLGPTIIEKTFYSVDYSYRQELNKSTRKKYFHLY